MHRRRLIGLLTGSALTGAAHAAWPLLRGRSPSDIESALAASRCTTQPVATVQRIAVRRDELSFAGTRLFKEGFLDEVGALYEKQTGRRIHILGGGCDDGLAAVNAGEAMIGGLCCPLEGSPARGLKHITVAQDLKVVVAHPKVDVDDVRWSDLVSLLTGRVRSWKAVGGSDRAVALVLHDHCPAYIEPARRMLLGDRLSWSRDALYVKTDQKHLDTVARFESAVGLNSWVLAEPYVSAGKLKLIAVDGIAPTVSNAARKRYRLIGPMNMVFRSWQPQVMGPFFDSLFAGGAQEILRRRMVPVARVNHRLP